mgnify:CR=1 FL=1
MDLYALTIHEAAALLAEGRITAVGLTGALLARIAAVDGRVHAYLRVAADDALAQAADADRRRAAGEHQPLLGVPLAIKDVLCTAGLETTCGSRILAGFIPPYSATAVARLRAAGAPALLKIEMQAGHGGVSGRYAAWEQIAFEHAWILQTLGLVE